MDLQSQPRTGHTREPDPTQNELKHTTTRKTATHERTPDKPHVHTHTHTSRHIGSPLTTDRLLANNAKPPCHFTTSQGSCEFLCDSTVNSKTQLRCARLCTRARRARRRGSCRQRSSPPLGRTAALPLRRWWPLAGATWACTSPTSRQCPWCCACRPCRASAPGAAADQGLCQAARSC